MKGEGGSDRFRIFLGGDLGKKGWGHYLRVGLIPWRTLCLLEKIVKLKKLLRIAFTPDFENLDRFTYETGKKKDVKVAIKV